MLDGGLYNKQELWCTANYLRLTRENFIGQELFHYAFHLPHMISNLRDKANSYQEFERKILEVR